MTPPTRAVGSDASKSGRSFAQSTSFPRLNSQVEYVAATILSNNAVGRISCAANDENAITARKAVPPAWPTVAYSSETTPNSKASTVLALSETLMEPLAWPVIAAVVTAAVGFGLALDQIKLPVMSALEVEQRAIDHGMEMWTWR